MNLDGLHPTPSSSNSTHLPSAITMDQSHNTLSSHLASRAELERKLESFRTDVTKSADEAKTFLERMSRPEVRDLPLRCPTMNSWTASLISTEKSSKQYGEQYRSLGIEAVTSDDTPASTSSKASAKLAFQELKATVRELEEKMTELRMCLKDTR